MAKSECLKEEVENRANSLPIVCILGTSEARCDFCAFSSSRIVHLVFLLCNFSTFNGSLKFSFTNVSAPCQSELVGAEPALLWDVRAASALCPRVAGAGYCSSLARVATDSWNALGWRGPRVP